MKQEGRMGHKPQIDYSSLSRAVSSLEEGVNAYIKNPENLFIRDATIQRFEYTYELAHKMLKRYLELSEPNAETIDQMAFPALIRTASERGLLLNGWDVWKLYRDARNITSHTYNEEKASNVCKMIPAFLSEVSYLLAKLQQALRLL